METFIIISISLITTAIISRVLILFLIHYSKRLGLIDRPANRKVHFKETPLIGGLAIMLTLITVCFIFLPLHELFVEHLYWSIAVLLIFSMALMDDRFQLTSRIRLIIQFFAAGLVAASGIRIVSMFGLFGIYELPLFVQYILTIVVIVGVTNAFNLLDGIDGLAGSFALINFGALGVLALSLGQEPIMIFCFTLVGGLFSFLRFNLYPAKIFMGDAGSMSLGFIMATISILLLQSAVNTSSISPFILVSSILIVPVTDALRVFLGRYVNGFSLFNADKTHLHHLLLERGKNHAQATMYLLLFHLIIVIGGYFLSDCLSTTACILPMIAFQLLLSKCFTLDKTVQNWLSVINRQEIS